MQGEIRLPQQAGSVLPTVLKHFKRRYVSPLYFGLAFSRLTRDIIKHIQCLVLIATALHTSLPQKPAQLESALAEATAKLSLSEPSLSVTNSPLSNGHARSGGLATSFGAGSTKSLPFDAQSPPFSSVFDGSNSVAPSLHATPPSTNSPEGAQLVSHGSWLNMRRALAV